MNSKEDYFRFSKNGNVHSLSNRIPFKWPEVLVVILSSLGLSLLFMGLIGGILISVLVTVGYILYRFAAWLFYDVLEIDMELQTLVKKSMFLNSQKNTAVLTDAFSPANFEFIEITRSGQQKFLLRYTTHKHFDLLILKNESDKMKVEQYIHDKLRDIP